MAEPGGNEARLEKIQGGVDVIREKLDSAQRIADERHEGVKADITDLRQGHHRISNRVGVLEAKDHVRDGERKGIMTSGRVLWAGIGALLGGSGLAGLLKLLGI